MLITVWYSAIVHSVFYKIFQGITFDKLAYIFYILKCTVGNSSVEKKTTRIIADKTIYDGIYY